MKLNKHIIILLVILLIAAVLRFWNLGKVPPSPDWDEAALGYNAYSILKTGRDEYGTKFPLVLRSFDDYKPPLYAYVAIPSIAVFGLNVWSVRLPSAIAGIITVLGVYFLVFQISQLNKSAKDDTWSNKGKVLALLSAFLLAISPWHLQFSRIAFEANIGLTLNVWGLTLFFWGLSKRRFYLIISAVIFALCFYAYHSERVFIPLLLVVLFFLFRKEIFAKPKIAYIALVTGILVLAPLVPVLFAKTTLVRLQGTSALSDQVKLLERTVKKLEADKLNHNPWGVIFDNRRLVYVQTVLRGYLSHYSLKWLFISGDNDRHHAPGMGLLYLWELPLVLYGMYLVAKGGGKKAILLISWFMIAPVAAAPTNETPHAIRSLVFLPTFQIFTATGILAVVAYLQNNFRKHRNLYAILIGTYGLCIIFNIVQYLNLYHVELNLEYSQNWQYGYQQAVEYAKQNQFKYEKIIVSTKLEQPYMFFLFFLKYDPVSYYKEGGTASGGFAEYGNKFSIYEFRPINWAAEVHDHKHLYVGTVNEIMEPLKTINYLDGIISIRIGE